MAVLAHAPERRSRHHTGPLAQLCQHTFRRRDPGVGSPRRPEKSHAPRRAAASVNADARGSATIFASQASRDSQMTLEPVVESVRRPHAVHHNQRRRSSAGEGGALSSQSCNARSTRCLASTSGKIVHGWDWVRSASQPQADPQGFVGRSTARFLVCTARKRYHWCLQCYIHCSWHKHTSATKFEHKRRAATAKIARLAPLSTLEFARAGRHA